MTATNDTEPLFDEITKPLPKAKAATIMRTRQSQCMRHGAHPLTAALGRTIPLHPDAAPQDDRDAPGLRCGGCLHRANVRADTAKSFPKCTFGARTRDARTTRGPGTDVRAWWPACASFEANPKEA